MLRIKHIIIIIAGLVATLTTVSTSARLLPMHYQGIDSGSALNAVMGSNVVNSVFSTGGTYDESMATTEAVSADFAVGGVFLEHIGGYITAVTPSMFITGTFDPGTIAAPDSSNSVSLLEFDISGSVYAPVVADDTTLASLTFDISGSVFAPQTVEGSEVASLEFDLSGIADYDYVEPGDYTASSVGEVFIDTGLKAEIGYDYATLAKADSTNAVVYGGVNTIDPTGRSYVFATTDSDLYAAWGEVTTNTGIAFDQGWHTFSKEHRDIVIDGSSTFGVNESFQNPMPNIYLFSYVENTTLVETGPSTLYYYRVWDDRYRTNFVQNIWPCPDNSIALGATVPCTNDCLYEAVSGTYIYPTGTGTFSVAAAPDEIPVAIWGLGSNLTQYVSNEPDREWYVDQRETGTYWSDNCGPAITEMVLNYQLPSNTNTAEDARAWSLATWPTEDVADGWWYGDMIQGFVTDNGGSMEGWWPYADGDDYGTWDGNLITNFNAVVVTNKIDEGQIVLVNIEAGVITQNMNRMQRTGRPYSYGSGHFAIIKGYAVVDGTLWYQVYDPNSLRERRADGTLVGKDQFYLASEVETSVLGWWDAMAYTTAVGSN